MADTKRILVADDDPDLIDLLETDLKREGYDVSIVTNGKDTLQILNKEKFHLVLLDVMMPYIDGYHVAYEVSLRQNSDIPKIVIMTSRDTTREKGIALMSGATAIIQKPFTLDDLHKKIAEVLAQE